MPPCRPLVAALTVLAITLPCLSADTADVKPCQLGPFAAALDPANAWLPRTLTVQHAGTDIPLLRENTGLNFTFTDFRLRSKFYREENRQVWAGKSEPRFVTEPHDVAAPLTTDGRTVAVTFRTSYADVERTLTADGQTLRITYVIKPATPLLVHEPGMFGVGLHFAAGWKRQAVVDGRTTTPAWLWRDIKGTAGYSVTTQHGGPMVLENPEAGLGAVVQADVPEGAARQWTIDKPVQFMVSLSVYPLGSPELAQAMDAALNSVPADRRAYMLLSVGRVLMSQGQLAEAEAALLESARLNTELATPYAALAEMRRDHAKEPGYNADMTQAQAWTEAAYRQPYNYGYILSGNTYWQDPRLNEAQRRLAIFNTLIAVENTTFYGDYYIWASRPFVAMGMTTQACAMLRQALWSLDHLPRPPAYTEKTRQRLQQELSELEKKLLEEEAVLPPLLPVRPTPGEGG